MDEQAVSPDQILAEVGRVRRLTRGALADGSWRYLSIWSVVFLGSWVTSFFSFGAYYWMVGVPAGYVAMWLVYRGQQPAAWNRETPYWVTGGSIAVANTAASLLLPDEAIVVVVWVVIGLGFGVLSWLDRQPAASGLFIGLAFTSAVLGVLAEDRFSLYGILALVFTVASGGAALTLWLWARRQGPSGSDELAGGPMPFRS